MNGPTEVTAEYLTAETPLPVPSEDADKEVRGRVIVVGGSVDVPGAVRLAGEAALRAGAGKLQLAVPEAITTGLGMIVPEARVFSLPARNGEIAPHGAETIEEFVSKSDAVLIGPGMIDKEQAAGLTGRLLSAVKGPGFVIDAAAMIQLGKDPDLVSGHDGRVVLTPHAGEMAALTGNGKHEVTADPLPLAREVAERLNAVVALKGKDTFVVSPDGRAWVYRGEAVGLATSGSGDVLAGIMAGLLARCASPEQAAIWAVYLHGQAGVRLSERVGPLGFLARELSGEVPALLAELTPRPGATGSSAGSPR
ncbi:MAG: NAD(P)H-hydrate dehydratase [Parcubacteria group bacterium]